MFEILFSKVRVLLKNPMILFVYGIVSKWYIAITLTALVVTFWMFKGLSDAGVIKMAEDVVFGAFREAKSVARYCVPKITDPKEFWDCLQSPPEYNETEEEKGLEKGLDDAANLYNKSSEDENPYDK